MRYGGRPAVERRLKWPNDVLVGDRKLAGILVERVAGPAGPVAVVGVGINVADHDELPVPTATSLALEGATLDRTDLLQAVLAGIAGELAGWRSSGGDPTGLRASYRAQCGTLGRDVRVELPGGGEVVGRAEDVDDQGRLVVRVAGGGTCALSAGDVVHLHQPNPPPALS